MKNLHEIDKYRDKSARVIAHFGGIGDHETGIFDVPSTIDRQALRVIASAGEGWDHVSISRPNRCPNWPEMEQIKRLFFKDDEAAFQLHLPVDDHISVHPYCLHIWRSHVGAIPMPPKWMVA